ncbi:G-protein coupled receptor GRL101-like [Lineus longissimus]|uniref:G-protein coupled receptor GRL101-like n=1 Tax=Lineus longissimus TaxID=88925 RepID=UPI002B4F6048
MENIRHNGCWTLLLFLCFYLPFSKAVQTDVQLVHENLCLVPRNERFLCESGDCVFHNKTCDGLRDCPGGDDEDKKLCGNRPTTLDTTCNPTDKSKYVCQDGSCIPKNRTCDGLIDCLYGEDEGPGQCGCLPHEFQCSNTSCIDAMKRCDRRQDCDNGADEQECETYTCPASHFKCDNHYCILREGMCNFQDDCGDNSDESACHRRPCYFREFQCNNSECIKTAMLCDGTVDCLDGSDEENCGTGAHFRCSMNGIYITMDKVCDKKADCPDHEDESKCGGCGSRDMQCPNGRCISAGNKCDGICDCADTCDDEADCSNDPFSCPAGEYYLCRDRHRDPKNRRCIAKDYVCDMVNNCMTGPKGAEEHFCPKPNQVSCPADKDLFACNDGTGRCILQRLICDHQSDCINGRDEMNCPNFEECGQGSFTCSNQECVLMSQRCDGEVDCIDRSDEIGCGTYTCGDSMKKCRNGQCVHESKWCNYHRDCFDNSDEERCVHKKCSLDEFTCRSGQCIPMEHKCVKDRDEQIGCADMSHLYDCRDYNCTVSSLDLYKCRNSYCIYQSRLCDQFIDCQLLLDDEDRPECVYNCPEREETCQCRETSMDCSGRGLNHTVPGTWEERGHSEFNFSHNHLGVTFSTKMFAGRENITILDLTDNNIDGIEEGSFNSLWRLKSLFLSYNNITRIAKGAFIGLRNVKSLHLEGNHIESLSSQAFDGLSSLTTLDLTRQNLTSIQEMTFKGLHQLRTLNLSRNQIEVIFNGAFFGSTRLQVIDLSHNSIQLLKPRAFSGLTSLKKLYLTNNLIDTLDGAVFTTLTSLEYMYTDEFRLCCPQRREGSECFPRPDEFSSCEDLMASYVLRVSLWVIGVVAFVGNLIVIVWRLQKGRESKSIQVHSFLITNLALGDLLMGIYLLIIATVDLQYRGVYIIHDERWRHSALCQVAGFLSTFSSELSVFTLTLITIDRLICIIFPFKIKNLGIKEARIVMLFLWLSVAIMAAIPLADIDYFRNFYGRSGVCLALHITPDKPTGWEYSVFVFIALNLISFVIIFVSYLWMFIVARRTQNAVRTAEMKRDIKKERAMAKRMTLIVMTDFFCWVPICILGIVSLCGTRIPQQIYAWVAVFVLPINAGINPVLYTLSTAPFIMHAWKRAENFSRSFKGDRWTKSSFVDDNSSTNAGGIRMRNLNLSETTTGTTRYQAIEAKAKANPRQNGKTTPQSHRFLENSLSLDDHTEIEAMDMCVIMADENASLKNSEVVYKRGART